MGIHPRLPGLTVDPGPGESLPAADPLAADTSRRAFLTKLALGGAAVTVGSQLVPATRLLPTAGAQEDGEGTTLDADETEVAFLASVALAAAAAYSRAVDPAVPTPLPEPVAVVVRGLGHHHTQQANALTAALPAGTDVEANATLVEEQAAALAGAGSPEAVLAVLQSLEERVVATQVAAVGAISSQVDARLVSTLPPVLAQHATVLGALAGQPLPDLLPPTQSDEGALTPEAYPVTSDGPATEPGDTTTTVVTDGGDGAEPGEGGTDAGGDGTETTGGGATGATEG